MSRIALLLLIVILAILGFFLIRQTRESNKILETDEQEVTLQSGGFDFQNWHEFSSQSGRFRVLLPTLPQHVTENISDPKFQGKKKYDMYVSEKMDGTVFMISLITFPDIPPSVDSKKLLTETMDEMISSNPENKLKSVEAGEYNGYPSLDFTLENNSVNIEAKTFLVGDTLYVLSRIVKEENYNPNEYNFFINSFELTPSSPKQS